MGQETRLGRLPRRGKDRHRPMQGVGSTTDVQIGSVTINTRATDAAGIARDLHSEIKGRFNSPSSLATQANTGLTP